MTIDPGAGKSHLAQAIGERACRQGHSACYTSAHQMLSQLRAARADQTLERRMLRYTAPDLLVVDDLGLRPLEGAEPIDLYEVIRQRCERGYAMSESMNSKIQWIKRKACGFRNLDRSREAIYFHLGALDMRPASLTHTNA